MNDISEDDDKEATMSAAGAQAYSMLSKSTAKFNQQVEQKMRDTEIYSHTQERSRRYNHK